MEKALTQCKALKLYEVIRLGGDTEMKRFFKHVGLQIGDEIRLVNQINHHSIIFLKGTRYAMEDKIAMHIEVKDLD